MDSQSQAEPLTLSGKFANISKEIALLEHEDAAEGLVTAALTNNHLALFGPPGTGKSFMSNEFCKRITGSRHFYKLLSRDMAPDELLVSEFIIKEWVDKNDGSKHTQFLKSTANMLPECEIAFLDEGFKANSTTLNKMLDIILDRRYMMNGEIKEAKTETVILASNEMPEDECKAFFDRILFRYVIEYIKEPQSFFSLLDFEYDGRTPTTVTMDEVRQAKDELQLLEVPKTIKQKFYELRKELADQGYIHSNRRWRACYNIIKASAWLQGKDIVDEEALEILQHTLWNNPNRQEIKKVRDIVLQSVNPIKQQILELYDEAQDVVRGVYHQKTDEDKQKHAIEANTKLKKIGKKMEGFIKQIEDKGKPTARYTELRNKITIMQSELVTDHLGINLKKI